MPAPETCPCHHWRIRIRRNRWKPAGCTRNPAPAQERNSRLAARANRPRLTRHRPGRDTRSTAAGTAHPGSERVPKHAADDLSPGRCARSRLRAKHSANARAAAPRRSAVAPAGRAAPAPLPAEARPEPTRHRHPSRAADSSAQSPCPVARKHRNCPPRAIRRKPFRQREPPRIEQ